MPVTEEVRDLILHAAPATKIGAAAVAAGMKTLRQAALMKVVDGTITLDEVLRVTLA